MNSFLRKLRHPALAGNKEMKGINYLKYSTQENFHINAAKEERLNQSNVFGYVLDDQKYTSDELKSQTVRFSLEGKTDQLIANVNELYFQRRAFYSALFDCNEDLIFTFCKDDRKFQQLVERILADVYQKRAVIINYLKEEGEWDAMLD